MNGPFYKLKGGDPVLRWGLGFIRHCVWNTIGIKHKVQKAIMDAVNQLAEDIKAEFTSYRDDVNAKINSLDATVASLQEQINNMPEGVDVTKLQADLDLIKSTHDALIGK